MDLLDPKQPPFDVEAWAQQPFYERARKSVQSFGIQGNGTPPGVFLFYGAKLVGYVGVFLVLRWLSEGDAAFLSSGFWLAPVSYQKAVAYTMLFEVTGFGCGSGPLTGRLKPMVGAFRHWLRPGTTKLPLFEGAPLIGGYRRTRLDVLLYATLLALLLRLLLMPAPSSADWWPVLLLLPLLGILDRPIFLAARAEHYWVMMIAFAFADDWVPGAMVVQLAMWFFAGVSKLNAHFPSVIAVMTSNSPTVPESMKRSMYCNYPEDMRPSGAAVRHAIAGTVLELGLPCVAIAAVLLPSQPLLVLAMAMALLLHGFILSNVPIGVPLEWNLMMLYGAYFLFWGHPHTTPFQVEPWPVAAFLGLTSVAVPVVGNFFPERVSFLLAMRYYAGNWPVSVYLIRRGAERKLDRLQKSAAWIADQGRSLRPTISDAQLQFSMATSQAFRLLHLHGRAIHSLLPELVDDLEAYDWVDGELIAGLALGWNFGEGHIHNERLVRALQAQCQFAPGELRCIFLEAQPLLGEDQGYRLYDACDGELAAGRFPVARMRPLQPWPKPSSTLDSAQEARG